MKDLFSLEGKNAVVVGGSGAIGQTIARGFADAGANVIITGRNEETLKQVVEESDAEIQAKLSYFVCDPANEGDVEKLVAHAAGKLGDIEILLNAQGLNKKFPGTEFPADVWDQMFAANVKSIMLTTKHFAAHMKAKGVKGKIINISSVRGARAVGSGGMGNVGYCATKGAVDMLTRAYASDLGPDIRVNAIGPTVTYTTMLAGLFASAEEANEKFGAHTPLQRIGVTEDCVGPAIFLASAASDFITGQILYPDGGLTAIG